MSQSISVSQSINVSNSNTHLIWCDSGKNTKRFQFILDEVKLQYCMVGGGCHPHRRHSDVLVLKSPLMLNKCNRFDVLL